MDSVPPSSSPPPIFSVETSSAEEVETQIVYRGVSYTVKFTPPQGYGSGNTGASFEYTTDHIKEIQNLAKSILEAEVRDHPDEIKIDTELSVDFIDYSTGPTGPNLHAKISIKKTSEQTFKPLNLQNRTIQTLFNQKIPSIYRMIKGSDLQSSPSPSPSRLSPVRHSPPSRSPRRRVHGGSITSSVPSVPSTIRPATTIPTSPSTISPLTPPPSRGSTSTPESDEA